MNNEQRAKWERTRARGFGRFMLLNAIVFGVSLTAATSVFDYFFSFNGIRASDLYFKVPIYMLSGVAFAALTWLIGEYQYRKAPTPNESDSGRIKP